MATALYQAGKPSIEFLELFALTAAVVTWCQKDTSLHNRRIKIFCDNESVMYMVNASASTCSQCRKLIRILTLCNIRYNNRIFVKHIRSKDNLLSDALSRLDFDRFWRNAPQSMNPKPDLLDERLWPINKIWNSQSEYLQHF